MGDSFLKEEATFNASAAYNELELFFSCARDIERFGNVYNLPSIWYFISDSKAHRRLALELHSNKILTNINVSVEHSAKENWSGPTSSHVGKEAFQTAAMEWWMFGLCDFFVYTKFSGFGRTAAMRSMSEKSHFSVPRDTPCYQQNHETIEDMSNTWSFI
ncbi:hypothetical protein CEUSTIGMA_g13667.t1 [Chlamydomonas eustigma]|uniref:Uncharacterized protein n=1 Tax=Chlamydomonas eustigma TaxID=1157962 RepID=A0A250XT71_9CHLO|nr:hypothetical protein CEUSTIGMA_g13667.t1 [Chlamydomonas eustigma]|eukprot:GAX86255.1 hypothetical protein CEUSTIGMA_g13667.t1 [Chlamydomonas eustigma]